MTDFDPVAYQMRKAMRRLVSGVTILTSCHHGVRRAMVATAVTSLSLEPPSLLISVNRKASMYPALHANASFCVNILAGHHEQIARLCSAQSSGEGRFEAGTWLRHVNGLPYLADAQAAIFCMVDRMFEYGSHGVFVGRVADVCTAGDVSPLAYFDGGYSTPIIKLVH